MMARLPAPDHRPCIWVAGPGWANGDRVTKRLRQISQLYFAAAALEVGDRVAFLAEAGADDDVRQEVECLLANETSADAFFGPPAIVMAAETLGNRPLTTVEDGCRLHQPHRLTRRRPRDI